MYTVTLQCTFALFIRTFVECGSSCLRCFQCVRLPHPSRVPILIVHLPHPNPVYTFVPPYSNCAPWPPSLSPTQPIIACSLRKQVRRHKLSQNKLFDPLLQDSTNLSKLSFVLLKVSGLLLPTFVGRCGGGALSKSLFFGRPQICDIPVRGEREFPFPAIPGNTGLPFPFPKIGNYFFIPVPVPKSWECYFSFPFPKFGNG